MSDTRKLSRLTRSLMVGVSTGTVALIQVGCAPVVEALNFDSVQASQQPTIVTTSAAEQRLCSRALETRSSADVDAFIRAYPASACVAPLINAMPTSTVVALSQEALSRVPRATWEDVSRNRAQALVQARKAPTLVVSVLSGDSDSDY